MISLKKQSTAFLFFLLIVIGIIGCNTPDHEIAEQHSTDTVNTDTLSLDTLKNRVALNQPDIQHINSKVYGDTIRAITYGEKEAVLITGNFSNGCTHLNNVRYSQSADTLIIHLEGWQPRDKICTQALIPFQYIDNSRSPEWLSQFKSYEFPTE